jgi:hypothetical protein
MESFSSPIQWSRRRRRGWSSGHWWTVARMGWRAKHSPEGGPANRRRRGRGHRHHPEATIVRHVTMAYSCRDRHSMAGALAQLEPIRLIPGTKTVPASTRPDHTSAVPCPGEPLEALAGKDHMRGMTDAMPPPCELVVRPCTIHAGRFRWEIRQRGQPVQSSADSFAAEHQAHIDGQRELEKLIRTGALDSD